MDAEDSLAATDSGRVRVAEVPVKVRRSAARIASRRDGSNLSRLTTFELRQGFSGEFVETILCSVTLVLAIPSLPVVLEEPITKRRELFGSQHFNFTLENLDLRHSTRKCTPSPLAEESWTVRIQRRRRRRRKTVGPAFRRVFVETIPSSPRSGRQAAPVRRRRSAARFAGLILGRLTDPRLKAGPTVLRRLQRREPGRTLGASVRALAWPTDTRSGRCTRGTGVGACPPCFS